MDPVGILILDDGELEPVARLLEELDIDYRRVRGGDAGERLPPPSELLITTPRRAELVRRGSPPGTRAGRPVRIIAASEDSSAMRRRLRRMGFQLLVRLPCEEEIWRLLVRRALYQGDERRGDPRVAMGAPVTLRTDLDASGPINGMLVDISNRGCRVSADAHLVEDAPISVELPARAAGGEPLSLSGSVAHLSEGAGAHGGPQAASVIFDESMDDETRARLGDLINHWSMGPPSLASGADESRPPLPPRESPALPGLTLDDETDPPVAIGERVALQVGRARDVVSDDRHGVATPLANDRRGRPRGVFTGPMLASSEESQRVLMGRDLSAHGMRVEPVPGLTVGDRFRLALYGPSPIERFEVSARVIRDDGREGMALGFEDVPESVARWLEKLVACLPDVESLEQDEAHGMGAVLSELLEEG